MIRLDHRQPMPESLRGAIIALGNFDGFHQGHQAVVGAAVDWARAEGRPAIVATFDPHPMRYFKPEAEPFRLTTLDQRQDLFAEAGVDAMLVFHFDGAMAGMEAAEWARVMVGEHLGAAGIVTGEDFTFGKGRGGNVDVLRDRGAAQDIVAETVGAVLLDGVRISSGRIREALQAGDPAAAIHQLTRPFAIRAEVIHGNKRGRGFGWPTANMKLGPYLRPAYGVYAVRVRLPDANGFGGAEYDGVANLGHRPMFEPEELLEAHLFDFDGDLYGQNIEVALHHYLRPEVKFETHDELIAQIGRDAEEAKRLLAAGATLA